MLRTFLAPLLALVAGACEPAETTTDPVVPTERGTQQQPTERAAQQPAEAPVELPSETSAASPDALAALRAHVEELRLKPEKDVDVVEVQHLLVSFAGTRTRATRSKEAAEQLAAELYQKILGGEDFDGLVKQYTDDSHPGIYGMTTDPAQASSNVRMRTGMVAAFGNVGWRLDVGEIGVAGFDTDTSPYGWHIIKRTK